MKHADAFKGKAKVKYAMPVVTPRNPDEPELIEGTVREVIGTRYCRLWNDPECRMLVITKELAAYMEAALKMDKKIKAEVKDGKVLKVTL